MKKIAALLPLILLFVCVNNVYAGTWHVPGNFDTIQEAINNPAVQAGDTILVGAGNHFGATVTKPVEIRGEEEAFINNGPSPWNMATRRTGFFFPPGAGGSGATISHLSFETVEFPVFSRGADDVTVEHCKMANPVQGVTNWHGLRWQVTNNEISDLRTMNGGGIGILFGAFNYVAITDNVAAHNKINGVLHMGSGELGGYSGTGIVLYSDARWGRTGASDIAYNQIVKNKVSLISENPGLVDVVAVELTDTLNNLNVSVVHDNAVGFNDLRATTLQIALTPENLDDDNSISRNLGENRGHGLHPSAFVGD